MKYKLFSFEKIALVLNIFLAIYCLFSFWIAAWFYQQTDWKTLEKNGDDYMFRHSCISVILIDLCIFCWSFVGIMSSFKKHNKKTTIYLVFLFVLLLHKTLYGVVFYTGGNTAGSDYHFNMNTRWENCCSRAESVHYSELLVWRITKINEIVSVILMFVIGNIGSICLYQISIT